MERARVKKIYLRMKRAHRIIMIIITVAVVARMITLVTTTTAKSVDIAHATRENQQNKNIFDCDSESKSEQRGTRKRGIIRKTRKQIEFQCEKSSEKRPQYKTARSNRSHINAIHK